MSVPRIRVLVVDDSAFARKVLREALSLHPDLEWVGNANDGLDALEKIAELKPDVITLDLVMPQLDGIGVLKALQGTPNPPRAVVVSTLEGETDLVLSALAHGAVDFVHKPTALATDRLYEISSAVAQRVRTAAMAKRPLPDEGRDLPAAVAGSTSTSLVVIGTSTGGPQALAHLLSEIPADFPVPLAIVLHIPQGYTEALAARLSAQCALEVLEARDGMALQRGRVVLARAGWHLRVRKVADQLEASLGSEPHDLPHCPSVDVLFQSAAEVCGRTLLAGVLTGMGDDGLVGAHAVKNRGGRVFTEAESSCVIYGMPRVVKEAGLSAQSVPLQKMAAALTKMVTQ